MSHNESFKRLASLQGSDPGFFVLAVHSFIEKILRESFTLEDPADDRFSSYLDAFKCEQIAKKNGFIPGLEVLSIINKQHQLTNEVRHHFASAAIEDARSATQHLRRFCKLAGIPEEDGFRTVLEYLKAWDERKSIPDLVKELDDLGYKYHLEKKSSKEMSARVEQLQLIEKEAAHLKTLVQEKNRAIAEMEQAKDRKDKRVDELRAERTRLATELKTAREKANAYDDAKVYLERLTRLTVLTRTRADYERSIIRLTPEQKLVLEQIRLDSDFLVKGSAGTGKTLVLLKAIEKAKGGGVQSSLGLEDLSGSVALLTYTNTLVKYDKYLSSILSSESGADKIQTADAFIRERLIAIDPGAEMDYEIIRELSKRYETKGLSPRELESEAENFIWANDVSREHYLDEMIERRGMKHRLSRDERVRVWESIEAMAAEMAGGRRYSKGYSRIQLLRHLESVPEDPRLGKVDYIFVDEAQDLAAADLKVIRSFARRAMILAGDSDQSIYQPGFTFRRAGIDISGRTRILKMNFRNTVAVHEVAERYRRTITGADTENEPTAFRDGPQPEVFLAEDRNSLANLLAGRVDLIIRHLGYDPENISILLPVEADIRFVQEHLSARGHKSADIRSKDFDFERADYIRLSTFHSAKGLDFPVVLLFLYRPPYPGGSFDEPTEDRMTRNLIYVAMTRAMDYLGVFTLQEPGSPAIRDLIATVLGPESGES